MKKKPMMVASSWEGRERGLSQSTRQGWGHEPIFYNDGRRHPHNIQSVCIKYQFSFQNYFEGVAPSEMACRKDELSPWLEETKEMEEASELRRPCATSSSVLLVTAEISFPKYTILSPISVDLSFTGLIYT